MKEPSPAKPQSDKDEERLLRRATLASVATALLLIAAKLMAWLSSGAVSLLASLVDSVLDAMASLLNFFAIRYALMPPDQNHRFGHGKAESLAALFQALFIISSSAFLFHEALHRLYAPRPIEALGLGTLVMLLSLVATGALVLYQRHVISKTHSMAIEADALHYRADLLSNAATLLALFLADQGQGAADPMIALGIAAYLLFSSREILRRALNELLDTELPDAERAEIRDLALADPQVRGVHGLRSRRSGRTRIIQLHLELDDDMVLSDAHAVGDNVTAALLARFPGADIVIHQDPASRGGS